MKKRFIVTLIIIGFSGIVAQVLLLREFLIRFYGNELSIGIILANWLILKAAGAFFLGKRIEYIKQKIEAFIILQLVFSFSLPLTIYLIRILNTIIGLTPGEGLGIAGIFLSCLFLLLPVCLSHGALFTFGCKVYSSLLGKDTSIEDINTAPFKNAGVIGRVYIYDTFGTLLGGIVFTGLLIKYFNSFQIALGISLLNSLACLLLLWPFLKPEKLFSTKIAGFATCIFLSLIFFLISKADYIHKYSLKKQWPQQNVVYYNNSVYGNVAVIERGGQYTFFSDGLPVFSSPTPDIIYVEEFVHLPMLSHPAPKGVLIIGGGAGGLINEVLKHSVERVDYCELDPSLIKAAYAFPTHITQAELSDPRVRINNIDGRLFLKITEYKYDVILVGVSSPSRLQTNRLFTEEFFSTVKQRLKKDGILAINLPGSLSYLSDELRKLNACIYDTLKQNLPYVKIIPGDVNIFIGSASKESGDISAASLARRLKQRNLRTSLITEKYIEYKLAHQRSGWFFESIKAVKTKINTDFRPTGVFYSLSYWNALFSPHTQKIFKLIEKIGLWTFAMPVIILVLLYLTMGYKNKKVKRYTLPYAILSTGFCGIIFDLVLIFAFQILYGFVYYWVGLLITAFMGGLAGGSLIMTMNFEKIKDDFTAFIRLEIAIIIFSLALPFVLFALKTYMDYFGSFFLVQIIFLTLSVISGFLVGAEFPLGNKIYLKTSASISQTAGLLYATDLLGGWIGGMLGAVVLVPILGLFKTCMLLVILKISSLAVLKLSYRQAKSPSAKL